MPKPDIPPDFEPVPPGEPTRPLKIYVVEIEPETSKYAWLWATLGAVILVVSAVGFWVLVAKFTTWPVTIAIFIVITLILIIVGLRHRR